MQRGCLDEGVFAVLGDLQGESVSVYIWCLEDVCGGIFPQYG